MSCHMRYVLLTVIIAFEYKHVLNKKRGTFSQNHPNILFFFSLFCIQSYTYSSHMLEVSYLLMQLQEKLKQLKMIKQMSLLMTAAEWLSHMNEIFKDF